MLKGCSGLIKLQFKEFFATIKNGLNIVIGKRRFTDNINDIE